MESLFQAFRGFLVEQEGYKGKVCGYNETHFILAVETTDTFKFFRTLKGKFFVEDERTIEKQMKKWQDQKSNQ